MARRKTNISIARATLVASIGAVFGWVIFSGIMDMFPQLDEFAPFWRIIIGVVGIVLLTKFGLMK